MALMLRDAALDARLLSMRAGEGVRASASRRSLFSRPSFCGAQRHQSRAAFGLDSRLNPGPGHFQQDLAVPLRFGLAGPTQTLQREITEFLGSFRHGASLQAGAAVFLAKRQS